MRQNSDMNQPLTWREAFNIGHPGLDAEHRRMMEAINEICAAYHARQDPQHLRILQRALILVAKEHFEHESAVLNELSAGRIDSPGRPFSTPAYVKAISKAAIKEHIAEHHRALSHLGFIFHRVQLGTRAAGSEYCAELKSWFIDHAVQYDANLKAIFQELQS